MEEKKIYEEASNEISNAQTAYLISVIAVADKYGFDRNDLIKTTLKTLGEVVESGDFTKTNTESTGNKEENENAAE